MTTTSSSTPNVHCIFHQDTNTCTYIVKDGSSDHAMIIDPVMDFEPASANTSNVHNLSVVEYCQEHNLIVDYIIETHVHADHLTGADYLKSQFPNAQTAIGEHVTEVQTLFQQVFHLTSEKDQFATDGSQFDRLLKDGEELLLGETRVKVLHTPGHTPACICLLVGNNNNKDYYAVFTGDTLFMPDMGTARCDFPGGSVEGLYNSIQRLYQECPNDDTKVFVGHDYGPGGRDICWETTIGTERQSNKQLTPNTPLETFLDFRTKRDAQLGAPRLLIPSLQVNLRNGAMPPPEENGTVYLKVPINVIGKK